MTMSPRTSVAVTLLQAGRCWSVLGIERSTFSDAFVSEFSNFAAHQLTQRNASPGVYTHLQKGTILQFWYLFLAALDIFSIVIPAVVILTWHPCSGSHRCNNPNFSRHDLIANHKRYVAYVQRSAVKKAKQSSAHREGVTKTLMLSRKTLSNKPC